MCPDLSPAWIAFFSTGFTALVGLVALWLTKRMELTKAKQDHGFALDDAAALDRRATLRKETAP